MESWVYIVAAIILVVVLIVVWLMYSGKLTMQSSKAECDALVLQACRTYIDTGGTQDKLSDLKTKCGIYSEYSWLSNSGYYQSKCQEILGKSSPLQSSPLR